MILKYQDKIIKEAATEEELIEFKGEFIRNKSNELSALIEKILRLESLKEAVIERPGDMSDEEYLNLVSQGFKDDLSEVLEGFGFEVKEIKYVNVPRGNIKIFTNDGKVVDFRELNGMARNAKPMDYEFTIE